MLDDIRQAAIERHQNAAFTRSDRQQLIVGDAAQSLLAGQSHVVAGLPKNRSYGIRNILIELDRRHSYAAGMGTIVSRARSAAYANAAGIASVGSVG